MRRRPLKTRPLEFVLSPVDNQRLANLCGTLDENLRQIETALDVTIARRETRYQDFFGFHRGLPRGD